MPNARVYWLHTLTPTHAGVGRGVGYIDLPIDRDAVTNWPLIRGSSFKGVWADHFGATENKRESDRLLKVAFGYQPKDGTEGNSGSLIPTDARLVCLPVRSFRGTFAWCTSSLALRMLRRTLELADLTNLPKVPDTSEEQNVLLPDGPGAMALVENKRVYLEDLDFTAVPSAETREWAKQIAGWVFPDDTAWQGEFKKRFAVLPDVVFDFLTETGTEVHTRVRISENTKTVESGALWTEESLPAETILAGVIACDRVFGRDGKDVTPDGLLDRFAREPLKNLQIGGKATVGRGQVRCVFTQTQTKGGVK